MIFSRPVLGVNTAVYGQVGLAEAVSKIAALGVDGVVIKLTHAMPPNAQFERQGMALLGLELADYAFGQLPEEMGQLLAWCQLNGCRHLIVPNPMQFEPATVAQADQFVADVQQWAETAVAYGVAIVVRVASRFETTLLNTVSQAEAFLGRVARPNVKVACGTFDLQIEEQNGPEQLVRLGERLAFLRMSDSNQGAIGEGNFKLGAYLWAVQELAHNPPILLDVKRPYLSPFTPDQSQKGVQERLEQSRSWF